MSITYNITTNFGQKDSLPSNDPNKVVRGQEFTTEFVSIKSAFELAAPSADPTFTGTVTIPTLNVENINVQEGSFTGSVTVEDLTVNGAFTSQGIDDNASDTAITIAPSGNVGIGTATPTEKLQVEGNIRLDNDDLLQWAGGGVNITGNNGDANMRFSTSGNERMRIDSTGNVGIGTASPDTKLDVSSGVNTDAGPVTITLGGIAANSRQASISKDASAGGHMTFTANTGTAGASDILFKSNVNLEAMRITSAGNVGIGTSGPGRNLVLFANSGPILQITDAAAGASAGNGLEIQQIGVNAFINNREAGTTRFLVNNTEHMRIDDSGNVGIGTTAPNDKLHVEGDISFGLRSESKDIYIGTKQSAGTWGNGNYIRIDNGVSGNIGDIALRTAGGNIKFETFNDAELMRITDSGDVGIGTDSPLGRFDVDGNVYVTSGGVLTTTVRIQAFYGTNTNPGYTFQGDNNTGMFRAAADQLGFSTGGSERVRIGSSGVVTGLFTGTGVTQNQSKFEVVSTMPGSPDSNTIYFVV